MFLEVSHIYLNYNCSNSLDMRNLQEQAKKALCYQKLFWPFTAQRLRRVKLIIWRFYFSKLPWVISECPAHFVEFYTAQGWLWRCLNAGTLGLFWQFWAYFVSKKFARAVGEANHLYRGFLPWKIKLKDINNHSSPSALCKAIGHLLSDNYCMYSKRCN